MMLEVFKYGVRIHGSNFSLELSRDEIIKLLFELKNDEYWFDVVNRIIESDDNTYVGSGECQFPVSCNEWFTCEKKYCNADICSNGYAYRLS
jgi:hypothetical protein